MFETQRFFRGRGSAPGEPEGGPASGRMKGRWRRHVVMLAAAAAVPLAVAAQAAPALAAVSPQVTISCTATNNCTASGTGFTPSGQVKVQALAGSTAFYSSTLTASAPSQVCVTGLKPHCYEVGGGAFTAALPVDYGLICDTTAAGTMEYTDVASGVTVSKPVTWTGPCVTPTTTTLSIPSTVDLRPDDRPRYSDELSRVLRRGGKYLLRASLRAAGVRNDIDEAVIAATFAAWTIEHMERAKVPSDTRMLEVIVARMSAPQHHLVRGSRSATGGYA
jgi:hypothetical protein